MIYQTSERHLDDCVAHLGEQEKEWPESVREESNAYRRYGLLEQGFVRAKWQDRRFEHLIACTCE